MVLLGGYRCDAGGCRAAIVFTHVVGNDDPPVERYVLLVDGTGTPCVLEANVGILRSCATVLAGEPAAPCNARLVAVMGGQQVESRSFCLREVDVL